MAGGRPIGSTSLERLAFFQRFDKLCKDHIDPLELMFKIAKAEGEFKKGWDKVHRLTAARELVSYRYPKLKAVENSLDVGDGQLKLTWLDSNDDPLDLSEPHGPTSNDPLQAASLSISASQQ